MDLSQLLVSLLTDYTLRTVALGTTVLGIVRDINLFPYFINFI